MKDEHLAERKLAIMQLKQGKRVSEVAQSLNHHRNWVWKWQKRFAERGWAGLREESRAPKRCKHKLSAEVRSAICQTRLELEAAAALGQGLKYIGGLAVRTQLKAQEVRPLPSVTSIERALREAGLTRAKVKQSKPAIIYPHLRPTDPHQLCQVDIAPHFLRGGQRVACFNAIDVVSRYPTGQAFGQRRAQDAAEFLNHVWQEMGVAHYTQVDNEGCFSGGATHAYVLGQVVRLALAVGTELVFSPVQHPESNGFVERFHQDYDRHVWQATYLDDLAAVNKQANHFFALYRHRQDHSQLQGQSPDECHNRLPPHKVAADDSLSSTKSPLRAGRIHFIRRVTPEGMVGILNVDWAVPTFDPKQGVWATLELQVDGATLSIFDAAPDVEARHCLAVYPFPLKEPLLPPPQPGHAAAVAHVSAQPPASPSLPTAQLPLLLKQTTKPESPPSRMCRVGHRLLMASVERTTHFTHPLFHTMF